jgi:HCOMODA/2-hydroxy-3-carboxy-muconic semialdehyde decarboxylase
MEIETSHAVLRDLVIANRILAAEGVVDAFGHVSIRHPNNPDRYIMACSRSPGIVTVDDLMEYTLDGDPLDQQGRPIYAERHIHGGVYETRPETLAVVHSHAEAVIPFGVTGVAIRPILHLGSTIGGDVPVWDIRDKFGDTTLLVMNMEQARDLANSMQGGPVALMRGHGSVIGGRGLKEAVMTANYLQINARLQLQALQLGEPKYLTPAETELGAERFVGELALERAWEYWSIRAGCNDL